MYSETDRYNVDLDNVTDDIASEHLNYYINVVGSEGDNKVLSNTAVVSWIWHK